MVLYTNYIASAVLLNYSFTSVILLFLLFDTILPTMTKIDELYLFSNTKFQQHRDIAFFQTYAIFTLYFNVKRNTSIQILIYLQFMIYFSSLVLNLFLVILISGTYPQKLQDHYHLPRYICKVRCPRRSPYWSWFINVHLEIIDPHFKTVCATKKVDFISCHFHGSKNITCIFNCTKSKCIEKYHIE